MAKFSVTLRETRRHELYVEAADRASAISTAWEILTDQPDREPEGCDYEDADPELDVTPCREDFDAAQD